MEAGGDFERRRHQRRPATLEPLCLDAARTNRRLQVDQPVRAAHAHDCARQRTSERHEIEIETLAINTIGTIHFSRRAFRVVAVDKQDAVDGTRGPHQKAEQFADRLGQRQRIVQRRGRLNQRQDFRHRVAKGHQLLMQAAARAWPAESDRAGVRTALRNVVAVESLILVEIIADAHPHRVERRRLVGETRNHDGDDVGIETRQVFEQLQAIVAGAQVPVENRQVDGLIVGMVRADSASAAARMRQPRLALFEPLAKGLANRFLVVDDEYSLSRFDTHGGSPGRRRSRMGCNLGRRDTLTHVIARSGDYWYLHRFCMFLIRQMHGPSLTLQARYETVP